jgi:hypothetical protein
VCQFCTETDHKLHPVVPLEEYEVKMAQLGEIGAEVQQMIQNRIRMIQGLKRNSIPQRNKLKSSSKSWNRK